MGNTWETAGKTSNSASQSPNTTPEASSKDLPGDMHRKVATGRRRGPNFLSPRSPMRSPGDVGTLRQDHLPSGTATANETMSQDPRPSDSPQGSPRSKVWLESDTENAGNSQSSHSLTPPQEKQSKNKMLGRGAPRRQATPPSTLP